MKRFYIAFAVLILFAATTSLFVFVSGHVRATPASEPTNPRGTVVKSTRTQKKVHVLQQDAPGTTSDHGKLP